MISGNLYGGVPGAVVEAAYLESQRSQVRHPLWHLNKIFLPRSLVKIKYRYCGEPTWPRSGVLVLRPLGLEFPVSGGQCHKYQRESRGTVKHIPILIIHKAMTQIYQVGIAPVCLK